VKFGHVVFEV